MSCVYGATACISAEHVVYYLPWRGVRAGCGRWACYRRRSRGRPATRAAGVHVIEDGVWVIYYERHLAQDAERAYKTALAAKKEVLRSTAERDIGEQRNRA